jgi:hypothetical protein
MKRMFWLVKQLLPLSYVSLYRADGKRYISTYRMWLGKVYSHRRLQVANGCVGC